MGSNSSASSRKSFKSEISEGYNQSELQQYIQYDQCCFIQYRRVFKKKLVWEKNILISLQALKDQGMINWADPLCKMIKANHLSRVPFLKGINELKYEQFPDKKENKQILLSPCQVQAFKKNLKQSALVSFASAKSSTKINPICNTPKQTKKMSSEQRPIRIVEKSKIQRLKRKKSNSLYMDHFGKSQSSDSSRSSIARSILRQSLISFVDDTLSSLLRSAEKQISKQSAYFLQIFIKFSMLLEEHFNNKKCVLYKIKKIFVSSMYDNYMPIINQHKFSNAKTGLKMQILQEMTDSTKIFIALMTETIVDYYHLETFNTSDSPNTLITNEQNLQTIVTAILFKDQSFYQIISQALKIFYKDKNTNLNLIMSGLVGATPEKFEIYPQYCLNTTTLRQFQARSSQTVELGNMNLLELVNYKEDKIPYQSCIEILTNLDTAKTPIAKMKIIMQCSEQITDCVKNFYVNHGIQLQKAVMDADQVLSIFQYILVRSKIDDLHTHLYILQHFLTDHQIISITGYYYSVLMCAVQQLQKENKPSSIRVENNSLMVDNY